MKPGSVVLSGSVLKKVLRRGRSDACRSRVCFLARSVIYGTGLNESAEAQRRLCSQLKQVNGSGQVEWA